MGGCENVLPIYGKEKDKRGENLFFRNIYTFLFTKDSLLKINKCLSVKKTITIKT